MADPLRALEAADCATALMQTTSFGADYIAHHQ
jgi:hypothetical protein